MKHRGKKSKLKYEHLDQVCATAEQQFDQWSAGSSAIQKLCAIT